MQKISITRDTRLALTTEAAGSLSNTHFCLQAFARTSQTALLQLLAPQLWSPHLE